MPLIATAVAAMQRRREVLEANMVGEPKAPALVTCSNVICRHEKIVNVDTYGDDLFVPLIRPKGAV